MEPAQAHVNPVVHRHVWAVIFPDGRIVTGTDLEDEESAWQIALGWPHADDIKRHKLLGAYATKAVLTYRPQVP